MKFIFLPLFLLMFSANAFTQEYFQQVVNYTIHVSLDDQRNMLTAQEEISYTNHSPDTLHVLWFHLWPNGYKDIHTAFAKQCRDQGNLDFQFSKEEEKGWIDSLHFSVEGKDLSWEYDSVHKDICRIQLNQPLFPGGTVKIATPFRVKIPSAGFSRLGHNDQAYFVTQWYPKPAVYDREGWHPMPYLNQGEFYSEFGSFDVFITLPENYTVAATGNMINCALEERRLDSLASFTTHILAHRRSNYVDLPLSSPTKKTLHFYQDKVHDFAWFADKRFLLERSEVQMPGSARTVKTAVYFLRDKNETWGKAISYLNNALYYHSLWVGEYPYDCASVVQGELSAGAGMEYPTITIIGSSSITAQSLEDVIFHEIGHNWFYGILGFNERQHPWLDEGLTSCYEDRYMEMRFPWRGEKPEFWPMLDELANTSARTKYLSWAYIHGLGLGMPPGLPADHYPPLQYGTDVYFQGSMNLTYLAKSAGQARFDTAMQAFFRDWRFKHPSPADFRQRMMTAYDDSLSWFFDGLMEEPAHIDYKLRGFRREATSAGDTMLTVKVINKSNIPGPFLMTAFKNKEVDTSWWHKGFTGQGELYFRDRAYESLQIDPPGYMPELYRRNNYLKMSGICSKAKPLALRPAYWLVDPSKNTIYFLPLIGKNTTDKFMLGLALYNDPFFSRHWEWAVVPMYAFGTDQLNGMGRIAYVVHPKGEKLREARIELGYKRFSYMEDEIVATSEKITPSLVLEFRSKDPLSPYRTQLAFRRPQISILSDPDDPEGNHPHTAQSLWGDYAMNELSYRLTNVRPLHPWSARFVFQNNEAFSRVFIEAKAAFIYNDRKKAIHIRMFAGHYLLSDPNDISDPGFHLRGISGHDDVYFDGIFPGRKETTGVYSQQFIEDEAAVKGPGTAEVVYDNLLSLNLKLDVPIGMPLRIFMDAAYYPGFSDEGELPMTAGISVPIVKNDIFEIFFPVFSAAVDGVDERLIDHYGQKIRFTLNLHKLDILRKAKNIIP